MSSHIGKETYVEVGDKRYRLSRYTREMDAEFVRWALDQLPDPIAEARKQCQGFSLDMQKVIVQDALETKRKRDAGVSEEINDIRSSQRGMWKVLCLLFQRHHPELTEHDVGNIFDQCILERGPDYLVDRIAEASGVVRNRDLPLDDQKKT